MLESKVNTLQNEIKNLLSIITNNNNEKHMNSKSSNCSCGKKSGDKKLISIGTNTSSENINFTAEKSASNKNDASTQNVMNINQNNSLLNSLNNHKNKQEEEDDRRYEAFLNENSLNFPKQFLDLENKENDSNFEENSITIKNNQIPKGIPSYNNKINQFEISNNQNIPPSIPSPINNNYNNIPNYPSHKLTSQNFTTSQGSMSNNNTISKNVSVMNETKNSIISNKVTNPINNANTNLSLKDSFSNRKLDYLKKYDETFGKNKILSSK